VNALLEVLILVALLSGFTSWAIGTHWARATTLVHGVTGLTVLVLAPAKYRGSVRAGLRRGRPSRFASVALGALVVSAAALAVLHTTGFWYGIGFWSALWTHFALAFAVVPFFVWHVSSRPVRAKRADLDRRALLGGGVAVTAAAAIYGTQELVVAATGLPGAERRFTGSHEAGSLRPEAMPVVQWINDVAPATDSGEWRLWLFGTVADLDELRARSVPVRATLDCTGGWWSTQDWDAVPLADLLPGRGARSIKVTSATGYSRLLPFTDADRLHLALGYGGQPLRRGHGAPVRLVAPGRRGPWWVKWVTAVDLDDRPWWAQFPFPLT
jgi:hypothetical protein